MAEPIKVKYSSSYRAKQARLKKLPKMIEGALSGLVKRDLIQINKIFHDGIQQNILGLDKLADLTGMRKIAKGYERAMSPLYGLGDQDKQRSYSNMMIIVPIKDGWKLRPKNLLHHSGKLKLKDLLTIHEHGAIIKRKKKDGTEVLIRIPPRPALLIAYRKWLVERRKKEPKNADVVRKAISNYINTGKDKELQILITHTEEFLGAI